MDDESESDNDISEDQPESGPVGDGARRAQQFEAYRSRAGEPSYDDELLTVYRAFESVEQFAGGDLVQWKPGLRYGKYPEYGFSAVFVRYLSPSELTAKQSVLLGPFLAPPDFDCYIGYIDGDGDFEIHPAASARLTVIRKRASEE